MFFALQMDEDGSGEVDFEEFLGWWKSKKAMSPRGAKNVTIVETKVRKTRISFEPFTFLNKLT